MRKRTGCVAAVLCMVAIVSDAGVGWRNVDEANHLGGRMASEGYLQGKVVMVCKKGGLATRLEDIWKSFKTKQFVLLGSWPKAAKACTFPMYRGAGLAEGEPGTSIYVVGATGRVVYKGEDDRAATESAVMALTDLDSPRTRLQWMEFLEFELRNLPAHAYLRYAAMKKVYPAAAKEYEDRITELRAIKDVDKVAKLVALAKQAKDRAAFDPKKKVQKANFARAVKGAIAKYASLKDCEDPKLAQEAKNALADLAWTHATL